MENRGSFASKLGVVLATAGSAVGLGNIWRFPYLTGENGGAAFILVYLVCVFILGIPGMVAEFIVGRHSASNAARAYRSLSKGEGWGAIGYVGMVTSMLILGIRLADMRLISLVNDWKVYMVAFVKLIVSPLLCLGVLMLCGLFLPIGSTVIIALYIIAAMPTASSVRFM